MIQRDWSDDELPILLCVFFFFLCDDVFIAMYKVLYSRIWTDRQVACGANHATLAGNILVPSTM